MYQLLFGFLPGRTFDSFRISMEKGADQENLKRPPLCGKLHINTKRNTYNNTHGIPSLSLLLCQKKLLNGQKSS
jgi:hypothetical protein